MLGITRVIKRASYIEPWLHAKFNVFLYTAELYFYSGMTGIHTILALLFYMVEDLVIAAALSHLSGNYLTGMECTCSASNYLPA